MMECLADVQQHCLPLVRMYTSYLVIHSALTSIKPCKYCMTWKIYSKGREFTVASDWGLFLRSILKHNATLDVELVGYEL